MVLFTLVSGSRVCVTERELRPGLTVPVMRENGTMTRPMAKESLFTLMETSTKVNGEMTRPMARVHILTQMEQSMSDSGEMINSMEEALRLGLMVPNMRENISMERSMEREPSTLQMDRFIQVISSIMTFRDPELMFGLMRENMKVNGREIKCMARERPPGLMEGSMKDNMLKIRRKVKVLSSGLMAENTLDNGKKGNSTEEESTSHPVEIKELVNGLTERESDGLMEMIEFEIYEL